MEFSHGLVQKSTAWVTYFLKKGTGCSLSEAVLIFTKREDTQVSTSNSAF